ncbi:MAG: radical SAM protein [Lachnospirales bacterium]
MEFEYIDAKKIIQTTNQKNKDFWFSYDYNMNIYRGCNHGCIYCDSRSDCYGIKDFEKVTIKKNSLQLIESELKNKRKTGVVGTGAMSDPYNHLEKQSLLTRNSLELILKYNFGIGITTKNDLITRDIDLLTKIQKYSPTIVKLSVSASSDELCKIIEPYAPTTSNRFNALEKLRLNNIYSGILMMPILPFITDNEKNINNLLDMAKNSGANFIYPGLAVSLRDTQRDVFFNYLDKDFKGLKEKYISTYRNSYWCNTENVKKLNYIITNFCEKNNISYKMKDIIADYKPSKPSEQLTLFDL